MARLTSSQWAEVRRRWEYDPEEPTYLDAARRAAKDGGFKAPSKSATQRRSITESWERRGSLLGVNQSAQRKADALVEADGSRAKNGTAKPKRDTKRDGKRDGKRKA